MERGSGEEQEAAAAGCRDPLDGLAFCVCAFK